MKYLLILLAVVLLFGSKKLPELGRSLGQSLREFKDATKGLADEDDANKKNAK
jgi:sec-independent protein translocase protein TatA